MPRKKIDMFLKENTPLGVVFGVKNIFFKKKIFFETTNLLFFAADDKFVIVFKKKHPLRVSCSIKKKYF